MSVVNFDKYLTVEEEKRLLKTVAKYGDVYAKRDLQWITLARNTGIRVTPLSLFTVANARQALIDGRFLISAATNKRGQKLDLHLNKAAATALKALLKINSAMTADLFNEQRPLILSRNGQGFSVRGFQDRLKHWSRLANVNCTPHTLRHTFAKRIIQNSTSPQALQIAQAVLGHRNIQTTTIYTLPDKEQITASIEQAAS